MKTDSQSQMCLWHSIYGMSSLGVGYNLVSAVWWNLLHIFNFLWQHKHKSKKHMFIEQLLSQLCTTNSRDSVFRENLACSCASHPVCLLLALLGLASIHKPLPEFGGDTGDVEGAGDGWGVERSQVGSGQSGPPMGLEVDHNELLLQ